MKKTLSLILAFSILLGCVSITAFAAGAIDTASIEIGGIGITAEGEFDHTTFPAITSGTVTFTSAANNNGIAKLTLDNATITGSIDRNDDNQQKPIEIELIGTNTINTSEDYAIGTNYNCFITGSGSLDATAGFATIGATNLTIGMQGTLTLNATNVEYGWGIDSYDIIIQPGAGKVIAHGGEYAIMSGGHLLGCKTLIGSADADETDESKMSPAVIDADREVSMIKDTETPAKTVVLTSYPFLTYGFTDITLTVAKELTYDIVIPEAVNIDAAGVHSVGQARVENVKNATDDTVISYTAYTTDFKCGDKDDITATYYTDEAGTTAFPTTAVEVYKNGEDVGAIPTMYVGISEDAWNAAENGTYTATVTYNFTSKVSSTLPAKQTPAAIINTVEGGFPTTNQLNAIPDNAWKDPETGSKAYIEKYLGYARLWISSGVLVNHETIEADLNDDGNYVYTTSRSNPNGTVETTYTFVMTDGKLSKIIFHRVDTPDGPGEIIEENATIVPPTSD